MKNILVLGATGAMGVYLVPELARNGYHVDAVSLDDVKENPENITYIQMNAKDDAAVKALLDKTKYDAIIDFILYNVDEFLGRMKMLLDNTQHYIFLSSYRVYSGLECPVKETTPRLLDVTTDMEFMSQADHLYALYKAREENLLRNSGYKNWTILRPSMVFSKRRYQLVAMEANTFLYRVQEGKTVLIPAVALDIQGAMIWAGDVAKMITRLVLNEKAYGEAFSVASSEKHTWREIIGYYEEIVGMKWATASTEDYQTLFVNERNTWYRHIYDRFYNRHMDNTKILEATGMKQEELMPLKEGLKLELGSIQGKHVWEESGLSRRMDELMERLQK